MYAIYTLYLSPSVSICLNVTADKHVNEIVHSNSLLSHVLVGIYPEYTSASLVMGAKSQQER